MDNFDKYFGIHLSNKNAAIDWLAVEITDQKKFDSLFQYLFSDVHTWVMIAASTIERITAECPAYLYKHKETLMAILEIPEGGGLKWFYAIILPRLDLTAMEQTDICMLLSNRALDKGEKEIVRVSCLQGMHHLAKRNGNYNNAYKLIVVKLKAEGRPYLNEKINSLQLL